MKPEDRKRRILAIIAEQYIRTGEPVGSKAIAALLDGAVSSATIRNDMAALFDMGLLEQPYVSAGRIPSHLGFRVYLDQLIRYETVAPHIRDEIDALFNVKNPDPEKLIEYVAEILSDETGCVAVTTTVTPENVTVRRVQMVLAGSRTLVIIVSASNGVVRDKVCRVDYPLNDNIVDFFNKFANDRLAGRSLHEISADFMNAVAVSLGEYSRIFSPVIIAIYGLCREIHDGSYFVKGTEKLLQYDRLNAQASNIIRWLDNRDAVRQIICGSGTRVIVGRENTKTELTDAAVVACNYQVGEQNGGAIGIVGPVNMDYARMIPHLEYFADMLAKILKDTYDE